MESRRNRGLIGMRVAIFGALLLQGTHVPAATFNKATVDGTTFIVMEGLIVKGDDSKFAAVTQDVTDAIIVMSGPGGNGLASTEIGLRIRELGLTTSVLAGKICASGCAIAWLAGRLRMMDVEARIGFHAAAQDAPDGSKVPSPVGNGLMGAYLNRIGITRPGIVYLMSAPHDGIRWIDVEAARNHGLEVLPMSIPVGSRVVVGQVDREKSIDWTGYGDWIVAGRHDERDKAIGQAEAIRRQNANTAVYSLKDGGFGVAVGPFSKGRGQSERDAMVMAREIPRGSVAGAGERFKAHVWGHKPTPRPGNAQ